MLIWKRKGPEEQMNKLSIKNAEHGAISVRLNRYQDIAEQLKLIGLNEEDLSMTKHIEYFIKANADTLVEFIYDKLGSQAGLVNIITSHSSLQKHIGILKQHLLNIFGADIDDSYVERRVRIAHVHVKIGLEIRFYVAAMQVIVNAISEVAQKAGYSMEDIMAMILTSTKLLNLEQQLVLHFYELKIKEERELIKDNVSKMASELAALSMQTSASVEEVVAHSGAATSNSRKGTELAGMTKLRANDGLSSIEILMESLKHVRSGMHRITSQIAALEDRASKIQDIASWVKDIANQTNLLSLNASIEAARAGEQGRGFAVVASEVKKLAQQTTQSVESITELTQGTIGEVVRIAESIGSIDKLTVDIEDKSNSVEQLFRTITDSIESNRDMNKHIEDELVHLSEVMEEIGKANETIAIASEKMDDFMRKI
jgi:heme-based aerotactic transducer